MCPPELWLPLGLDDVGTPTKPPCPRLTLCSTRMAQCTTSLRLLGSNTLTPTTIWLFKPSMKCCANYVGLSLIPKKGMSSQNLHSYSTTVIVYYLRLWNSSDLCFFHSFGRNHSWKLSKNNSHVTLFMFMPSFFSLIVHQVALNISRLVIRNVALTLLSKSCIEKTLLRAISH